MAIEWSGLSPELLVRLDRSASQPLRAQLEASLREAIRSGRLPGRGTAPVLAGASACARRFPRHGAGLLRATAGRGLPDQPYRVRHPGRRPRRPGSRRRARGRPAAVSPSASSPFRRPPEPPLIADFQPGVPDLSSFPRTDWAWAVKQACTEAAAADLGYGDPRGSAVLREVLAGYLRRVRAAAASPARMIISTGFAQGINLVLRALVAESGVTCVAFEDPGYGSAQEDETVRAALAMGLHIAHVPVDGQGLVVSELAASGAQAVVVTPAHQSPTGVLLSPSRRHALTDWARSGGGYVIEDDYDSEFRYDKEPIGTLQGLAPDQVFLLGTASKALAPAVRLGWVHAPAPLASAVAAEKEMSDRGSCMLDQLALATLLTTGRFDRHLRRMRTVYAARRTALTGAFARHVPQVQLTGLAAGFHAVAPLPPGADETAVIAAARDRRVGLHGISGYRGHPDRAAPPALVMGFGNVRERAIEPAIAAVADLLS